MNKVTRLVHVCSSEKHSLFVIAKHIFKKRRKMRKKLKCFKNNQHAYNFFHHIYKNIATYFKIT